MTRAIGAVSSGPRLSDNGRQRRRLFERYSANLAAQLDAIEAEDIDRLAELVDDRDRLAEQLDAWSREGRSGARQDRSGPDRSPDESDELREVLDRCVDLDRRILEALRRARSEMLEAIQTMDRKRPAMQGYMQPRQPAGRIDVRF